MDMIGRTVSHYRIVEKLGEGGMGVVYRAEDVNLGRPVALKVLSAQLVSDPKARKRFLREAKAAAALDHPGICTVYEAGEVEGQLFIAMALLEGQTLRDRIAARPLSIDESLDIAGQVAGALKEAHAKGIVHRDIKPGNIMLLSSAQVKVMDFGLARLEGATQLTRTGMTLGTVAYMSPEQLRGEVVDARSDIWSLGVVLYEMISGVMPFRGEYEPAIEYGIEHDEPEALGSIRPEAGRELEKLVGTCLKKRAAERFQSAEELLVDLNRARSAAISAPSKAPSGPAVKPEPRPTAATKPTILPGTSATAVQILGDRYRIERLLGRGGMGEVWLAFDLKLGVEVALKFLLPEVSSDPQRIALLRREVRTARNVASPHVCRVFDLIEIEGQELVSMEYVDGTTLQDLLATQSPLDIVEARGIATQLLTGLQDIHHAGLIHRDLKPANVMITRSGRAVVMDFGLAKGVADTQKTIAVAGTPAYMAPEQMRGEELDARADLYAVGIMLAEMVAPAGVRDTALRRKLWDGLRQDPPKAPAGPWEGAIRRAVAANRGERFASAAEMARALGDGGRRLSGIEEVSPYPGLFSFTGEQAKFFFGRELDVESMWRKISRLSLAVLIGPSGVGKSSFLRAGVIAAKPEDWNVVFCTPGDAPFTSLAQSLLPDFVGQTDAMRDLLRLSDIDRAIPLLHGWRQRSKQALLVVDQFEELFALNPPEVQGRFAEFLGRLSVEADIHVLVSMRDDFFFLCHQYQALRPVFLDATPLGPLSTKDLRRAIVEPARLCGFAFEDEALVDEIMKDVEGERGALPLMAFAAARLWELRDREHGVITRRSYEEIGRVGGALAQHAEATLEKIGHERENIVREIFRNLVSIQHTRVVREREELLSVFDDRTTAEEVLKALIDARLLTSFEVPETREGSKERRRVEVVHESLLTSWPRLVRWQTQDADGAQLRDQLRQAAQLWKEKSESDDLLWVGTAYQEFELWRERYPGGLTETEDAFGKAMEARAKRDRRRRRIVLGSAFAVMLAVIVAISWSLISERHSRLAAEASKLVTLGRAELGENPSASLAYALAALDLSDTPSNRYFALEARADSPIARIASLPAAIQAASLNFSPDGSRLVVGGLGGVVVLSRDGAPPVLIDQSYTNNSRNPMFAPDGDRILFRAGEDSTLIRVWSLSAGKEVRTFRMKGSVAWPSVRRNRAFILVFTGAHAAIGEATRCDVWAWSFDDREPELVSHWDLDGVGKYRIDPSGRQVAYTRDNRVYVCPVESFDAGHSRLIGEHSSRATYVTFDPTGTRVASADVSGEIRLWSLSAASSTPLRVVKATPPVDAVCVDSSGTFLAAMCTVKKDICVWDLKGPRDADPAVFSYKGKRWGSAMAFDPGGQWVAVAYFDEIAFWPLVRPDRYQVKGVIAVFTPDGQSLVGAGASSRDVRLWDLHGGPTRELWKAPGDVYSAGIDPSGRLVAVGTNEEGMFLISMPDGKVRELYAGDGFAQPLLFSPDGRRLACFIWAASHQDARVWDLKSDSVRVLGTRKLNCASSVMRFSRDGSLFVSDDERNIERWNLESGKCTFVARFPLPFMINLAVSRDSRFLVEASCANFPSMRHGSSTKDELTFFDLQSHTSRPILTHGEYLRDVALDPRDSLLVTADRDGPTRVGPVTGEEPHILFVPPDGLFLEVSPDGRWIVSSGDSLVYLARIPEGRPLQTLPHKEFVSSLEALTNLRVVRDKTSQSGYRVDTGRFAGWGKVPPR
jgi:serine/threonine protein kinase/WD40 repeat protein